MTRRHTPTFRELTTREAHALLERNHVGRIAYSFRNRVDIEPISYVFADGAIYMRTAPGTKLTLLAHVPWVAFEVDEVEGPFDWRSVVAHGTVYVVTNTGSDDDRKRYADAVKRLRELSPTALMAGDPVPERRVVLKLHLAEVAGREAHPAVPVKKPRRLRAAQKTARQENNGRKTMKKAAARKARARGG